MAFSRGSGVGPFEVSIVNCSRNLTFWWGESNDRPAYVRWSLMSPIVMNGELARRKKASLTFSMVTELRFICWSSSASRWPSVLLES